MPKIDLKLIAATALILGLFAGFYADNTLQSKPRIQTLTDTVNQKTTLIADLETQLTTLQGEHTTLQALYDQLNTNNVPLNQYTQLQQHSLDQEIQIENQLTQITTLTNTLTTRENTINSLDAQLDILQSDYDRLQSRYDAVYNPLYVAFTANNLMINITTNTDTYPDNVPIAGTVTIKHLDGTPFQGTYKLSLYKVYINSGTPSGVYTINGASIYTWSSPFVLGAGSYKFSISEIKDPLGAEAVPSSLLRNQVIYLFVG
jgi:hypothetical protein